MPAADLPDESPLTPHESAELADATAGQELERRADETSAPADDMLDELSSELLTALLAWPETVVDGAGALADGSVEAAAELVGGLGELLGGLFEDLGN